MKRAGVAAVLALAACAHEQPFLPGQYGPDGPYSPGASWQLTFSPADDRMPAWTPGEASLWYEFTRTDRPDQDHCLGLLPYPGGSRLNELCYLSPTADDSTDVFESPSVAPDGRVAFVHVQGRRGFGTPSRGALLVAHPGTVQRVVRLPPPTAGGSSYDRAGYIQWLSPDTLAWVAQLWMPLRIFPALVPDTFLIGLGVDVLRLGDSIPVRVPGTDSATSLASGDTAGVLYFTRFDDSRVYRLALATGDTSTLFDFGALGIARDVQVRAGRLLAVVGGDSAYFDSVVLQPLQGGDGGPLYFVDLAVGIPTLAGDAAARYRRPVLSGDGRTVVVERASPGQPDLWVVSLP